MSHPAQGSLRVQARALDAWLERGRVALGALSERFATVARRAGGSSLLRQGLAAVERGNLEAGFWLLREDVARRPDDALSAWAFWDAAVACGRAESAAATLARLVRRQAGAGQPELAAASWVALEEASPDAPVEAQTLVRMLPALKARVEQARDGQARAAAHGWLVRALRRSVEAGSGLSPGLALRVFEEARRIDADTARRAAEVALASPDLHEAKRARLEAQLHGLPPAAREPGELAPVPVAPFAAPIARAPVAAPAAAVAPAVALPAAAVAPAVALPAAAVAPAVALPAAAVAPAPVAPLAGALAPAVTSPAAVLGPAPVRAFAVTEGTPVELGAQGLVLEEKATGLRSRLDPASVEAVSVGAVGGLAVKPVLLVDLLLRGRAPHGARPRAVVRLRSDAFDPARLVAPGGGGQDPLRAFLAELLERTRAVPLPDPDAALGVRPRHFASVAAYETVLIDHLRSAAA